MQTTPIDLVRLIRTHLAQYETTEIGVSEVLKGLNRHLVNTEAYVPPKPSLPSKRKSLLDSAVAAISDPALQQLAKVIMDTQYQLTWRIDRGLFYPEKADLGEGYRNGNLHTEIIGPNGCIYQDDAFSLGLFMLPPATLYRDHAHAAPELYFNLTGPSGWRFNLESWQDFAAGSVIWNPSGLAHATRVYDEPFLAVYSWTEQVDSLCSVVKANDWQEIEQDLANKSVNNILHIN